MMVVDCNMTDLLCMRLCSEPSQAESTPRHGKAEVGLSIWSSRGMTIPEAMETTARGLDGVIEEELGKLAARGTAEDVLIQERARLEARRTAILAELWTKLEGELGRE